MEQGEVRLEGGRAGEEEDLEGEGRGGQGGGEGMVLEVGVPAVGEEVLEEARNLEEGGQEAKGPEEAAQTPQGRARAEGVCPHEEAQPEAEGDPDLEEAQGGRGEQGGLEEAVEVPACQESVVEGLPDQEDLEGSGLGQGVPGTCSCHRVLPWGTHETHRGAQLYLLQTFVPGYLSFYGTASQTGSGTVCYMV